MDLIICEENIFAGNLSCYWFSTEYIAQMTVEIIFEDNEVENKYFILKNQIQNNIQLKLKNLLINFLLEECYMDCNKIILKGQVL